jgi:hypothetical protein
MYIFVGTGRACTAEQHPYPDFYAHQAWKNAYYKTAKLTSAKLS